MKNENKEPLITMSELGFKASLMLIATYSALMVANPSRHLTPEQSSKALDAQIDIILGMMRQREKEGRFDD
jgi:hypothetical protein